MQIRCFHHSTHIELQKSFGFCSALAACSVGKKSFQSSSLRNETNTRRCASAGVKWKIKNEGFVFILHNSQSAKMKEERAFRCTVWCCERDWSESIMQRTRARTEIASQWEKVFRCCWAHFEVCFRKSGWRCVEITSRGRFIDDRTSEACFRMHSKPELQTSPRWLCERPDDDGDALSSSSQRKRLRLKAFCNRKCVGLRCDW